MQISNIVGSEKDRIKGKSSFVLFLSLLVAQLLLRKQLSPSLYRRKFRTKERQSCEKFNQHQFTLFNKWEEGDTSDEDEKEKILDRVAGLSG